LWQPTLRGERRAYGKVLLSQSDFFALEEILTATLGQQGPEACLSAGLRCNTPGGVGVE
jgi:hypothetical protein